MILDIDSLADETLLYCDICLVGAGAVGMAIGRELAASNLKTVILESGSLHEHAATQALYDSQIVGLPFIGATQGRFRVLGGTTTRWGGQSLPLDSIDLEKRSWIPHSGWPLKLDCIAPYYLRAADYLGIDSLDYANDLFKTFSVDPLPVDKAVLRYHFTKFAPRPDLTRAYCPLLKAAENVTLLIRANLTRIDLSPARDGVTRIMAMSLSGRRLYVNPSHLVLCTGGIETARILLSNDHQATAGIGNSHDLVGRFLQDHPATTIGAFDNPDIDRLNRYLNLFFRRHRKYSVRLSASEDFQRKRNILNLSSEVVFDLPADDAFRMLKDARRLIRHRNFSVDIPRKVLAAGLAARSVARPIYEYVANGRQYVTTARPQVTVISEQAPDPESRVALSNERDALGMRKSRITWKLSDLTAYSVRLFATALSEQLLRTGIGQLQLRPWIRDVNSEWRSEFRDYFHHMGTARMSDDPRAGVVDRDCRVHGIRNLYIAGSAVFPTSGHANPTFTAIALALRIADRLKETRV